MIVHIFRNVFVEPAIKDLQLSISKNFKFKIYDYENFFNITNIKSESLILYIIDLKKIKRKNNFIIKINQIKKILKKKKCQIYVLYLNKKKENFKSIVSLNLSNFIISNKNKNPALVFNTNAIEKIKHIIFLLINININQKIRALALDLDNTLWDGVIGEDTKLRLNYLQKENLRLIKNLIDKGLIISIVSKNNIKDVEKYKNKTFKYILNKSKKFINWNEKLFSINKFIKWSKIHESNIIFVDDSHIEIQKIQGRFNKILCINAQEIEIFNFFLRAMNQDLQKNTTSSKRILDLKNNEKREEIQKKNINIKKFFQIIKPEVIFFRNHKKHLNRLEEMSLKINQFNTTTKRYIKKEFEKIFENINNYVFTISLKDKFGDSGVIGYMIFDSTKKNHLKIIDLKLSCRALGRNLEFYFIYTLIKKYFNKYKFLTIDFKKTNRNSPAKKLLENHGLLKGKIDLKKIMKFRNEKEIITKFR
jgi:FkbH-like protein